MPLIDLNLLFLTVVLNLWFWGSACENPLQFACYPVGGGGVEGFSCRQQAVQWGFEFSSALYIICPAMSHENLQFFLKLGVTDSFFSSLLQTELFCLVARWIQPCMRLFWWELKSTQLGSMHECISSWWVCMQFVSVDLWWPEELLPMLQYEVLNRPKLSPMR